MNIYVDRKPENCNHCMFNQNASKYLDVEDYCILNKKNICRISMDRDCPLMEMKSKRKCSIKILRTLFKKRRYKDVGSISDLIQMNTDTLFTGKDGKAIKIKVPEPEYIDSIW